MDGMIATTVTARPASRSVGPRSRNTTEAPRQSAWLRMNTVSLRQREVRPSYWGHAQNEKNSRNRAAWISSGAVAAVKYELLSRNPMPSKDGLLTQS